MANSIRIMEWNANGLLQHQKELQAVLDIEKIDICLISETHFTNESFIKVKGYKVYYTTHPENTAKGGSAVIIKESIKHHEEMGYKSEKFQATSVSVKTKTHEIIVTAVYCPPKHSIKKEQYIDFLCRQGYRFIIGGDFNAKHTHWGSRLTTTKGKELLEAIKQLKCESLSTAKPTYWPTDPNKIPDLIDFFVVRNISVNYIQVEEAWDLNSDHSPILLTLSDSIIKKEKTPALFNRLTDWQSFQIDLEKSVNLSVPLRTKEQIDEEVELLVKNIQKAAWNNSPTISTRTKGNNYPKEIRVLITEKRKLRRKWQQSRAPTDKTILNNATQHLKREIWKIKNESISTYLSELSNESSTDYSLWKATKKLKRPIMQNPPIRNEDASWARSNIQKANRFANHLENTFQPNEGNELPIWEIPNQDKIEITPVTSKEVTNEIKLNMNPKKAPGFDLITGEILKQLPKKAIIKLTHLINASFRLKYVPKSWKVAEVIMIHKPGKQPHEATSYRPISLLPVISKLFEKLLLKRLKPIIEERNLIPSHQFGFRENHSTIDQVHRITNIIEKSLEERKVCSAIFLDVAQAFDKVWHEGLKHKMNCLLPKQYSQLLESYISDRVFRVKQEESYSELREIKAGVPQGSVLGPVLYLLYTCDLPTLDYSTLATFADDTAILAEGKDHEEAANKLQTFIGHINTWTREWRIKLNEAKSVHVNFTNKREHHIPISINNAQIPYATSAKYLGITLDAKLRWKVHVKKKREQLELKFRKMYWLLGRSSTLSIYNKVLLYKQILMPVWTYGSQLWGCTKESNIQIIQRFQNKVLRSIVNAPWYFRNSDLHKDLEIDTVSQTIAKFAKGHEKRLLDHVNVEAIQLLDNTNQIRRLKRTKPFELVK
jgi:hypothetical protein